MGEGAMGDPNCELGGHASPPPPPPPRPIVTPLRWRLFSISLASQFTNMWLEVCVRGGGLINYPFILYIQDINIPEINCGQRPLVILINVLFSQHAARAILYSTIRRARVCFISVIPPHWPKSLSWIWITTSHQFLVVRYQAQDGNQLRKDVFHYLTL